MKIPIVLTLILISLFFSAIAQVSINHEGLPADSSAMLDVGSASKGFLPPRMTLAEMNSIQKPATGLMVFCTTTGQYHFNHGSPEQPQWAGTMSLPFSGNFHYESPLMDITNTGEGGLAKYTLTDSLSISPVVQATTYGPGNAGVFYAAHPGSTAATVIAGAGYGNAIYGYNSSDDFSAIYAQNFGDGSTLFAEALQGNSIVAKSAGSSKFTVYARNDSTGPVVGISGKAGYGLFAENNSNIQSTIYASNSGNYNTIYARGINGNALVTENSSNTASTIYARNSGSFTTMASVATTGHALYAENNSAGYSTIYAKNTSTSGVSAIFAEISNGYPAIYGRNNRTSGDRSGGYFEAGDSYAWVGCNFSNTSYKITGTGSVSTIVDAPDGAKVHMFCPESPEILLTDYGEGELVNGRCYITLDPVFSHNIVIDTDHRLRVFIQPEGPCNGVYVTGKSAEGFEVVELLEGRSDIPFSWYVVASRADERDAAGNLVSKNVGVRFPAAPAIRTTDDR